jgi:hypothetical protein
MIKINVSYDPKQRKELILQNLDVNRVYNISFGSKNKDIPSIYSKSLEYIPNFLEPLLNIALKNNFRYRNTLFLYSKLISNFTLHEFISKKTSEKERQFIITNIIKLDPNKTHLFLYDFINNLEIYKYHKKSSYNLKKRFIGIKKGLLNKNLISSSLSGSCFETAHGFIQAFKEGKIYTSKVKIDDKYKRVFLKTPTHGGIYGFNKLCLDPTTLIVYSFRTNIFGKIVKIYNGQKLSFLESKSYITNLKKEMTSYIKRTLKNQKKYRSEVIKERNTKKVIKRVTLRK